MTVESPFDVARMTSYNLLLPVVLLCETLKLNPKCMKWVNFFRPFRSKIGSNFLIQLPPLELTYQEDKHINKSEAFEVNGIVIFVHVLWYCEVIDIQYVDLRSSLC